MRSLPGGKDKSVLTAAHAEPMWNVTARASRSFVLPPAVLIAWLLVLAGALLARPAPTAAQSTSPQSIDDFESYAPGATPAQWKYITREEEARPASTKTGPDKRFSVVEEAGNRFVRAFTQGKALRFTQRNGSEFDWRLGRRPYLQWKWRANRLPQGASEKGKNDTGGAVYVTFGSDWLGRPKSIKYTYSSSLPVGTVLDFGPLKVLVVASGREDTGHWRTETRNVVQDYRNLFGDDPPGKPLSITLWSDSDSTGSTAEVDFDDIRLLAQP